MKVIIKGKPKEIADLALELQNRQKSKTIKTEEKLSDDVFSQTVLKAIHGIAEEG